MIKLLALDPIHEAGLALLRDRPEIDLVHLPDPQEDEIARHMQDAEILLLRGRHLARTHFDAATCLRLITRHGVGCDNLDFDQMGRNGVTVAISADANYISVAEHALALTMAACRNLVVADRAARSGQWTRRDHLGAREIAGSTCLVVGFGRIGRAYAERMLALGAALTVFDPHLPEPADLPPGMTRAIDLGTALGEPDIVSLHLPFTDQTANLFDADCLGRLRKGAILINTGRGGIVEESALLTALDAGQPAIYATDVLASEPPSDTDPLLARTDVIVTPHSAAMTQEGAKRMATGAAQNALDFIDGCLPARMIAFAPPAPASVKQS